MAIPAMNGKGRTFLTLSSLRRLKNCNKRFFPSSGVIKKEIHIDNMFNSGTIFLKV